MTIRCALNLHANDEIEFIIIFSGGPVATGREGTSPSVQIMLGTTKPFKTCRWYTFVAECAAGRASPSERSQGSQLALSRSSPPHSFRKGGEESIDSVSTNNQNNHFE